MPKLINRTGFEGPWGKLEDLFILGSLRWSCRKMSQKDSRPWWLGRKSRNIGSEVSGFESFPSYFQLSIKNVLFFFWVSYGGSDMIGDHLIKTKGKKHPRRRIGNGLLTIQLSFLKYMLQIHLRWLIKICLTTKH